MATLIDHLIKLTDHRDRDLLELTLSKALIDLVPIQRVIVARVVSEEGIKRWLEVATLDAKGGGKVVDPLRVDFQKLPLLDDNRDRLRALQNRERIEIAWAGEDGPRITYFPLFAETLHDDEGALEIHSASPLTAEQLQTLAQVQHVFRNMYHLLAYSDRDALTGLLNRKSLDDTFYSAVLDELGEGPEPQSDALKAVVAPGQERRHRVPPNYRQLRPAQRQERPPDCRRGAAAGGAHHEQHLPHLRPPVPPGRRTVCRAYALSRRGLGAGRV